MPLVGKCASCGTRSLLNPDGSCSKGHPRSDVSEVIEQDEIALQSILSSASKKIAGMFAGLKKPKTPEQAELQEAQKEYDERVSAAFAALAEAAAPADMALKEARAALDAAKAYGTKKLGAFEGLTLYEHALITPSGTVNLESDQLRVAVDTAGNLIESDSLAAVVKCDPDKGAKARQFVAKIQTTAAGAPARGQKRAQLVAQCQQHLDDTMIERHSVLAEPRAAVRAAQLDTERLDAAKAALS